MGKKKLLQCIFCRANAGNDRLCSNHRYLVQNYEIHDLSIFGPVMR